MVFEMLVSRMTHVQEVRPVHSNQITCLGRDCGDPRCGSEFVYIGLQRVSIEVILDNIARNKCSYWTLVDGQALPVAIETDPSTGSPFVTIAATGK